MDKPQIILTSAGKKVFMGTLSKEKTNVQITSLRGVGVNILDLSKISLSLMEQRIRNGIKDIFGERATMQVCYSDTDSISFCIYYKSKEDLGERIEELLIDKYPEHFDTSNYPQNHKSYKPETRKLLDRFQFENTYGSKDRIVELISSAVKEYNKRTLSEENIQKHKEISQKVQYSHQGYMERVATMRSKTDKTVQPQKIQLKRMVQTKNEKIIESYDKVMFSSLSDKRYVFMDGITTCAYGHHKLKPVRDYFKNFIALHNGNESSILEDQCLRRAINIEKTIVDDWPEMKTRMAYNKMVAEKHLNKFAKK